MWSNARCVISYTAGNRRENMGVMKERLQKVSQLHARGRRKRKDLEVWEDV